MSNSNNNILSDNPPIEKISAPKKGKLICHIMQDNQEIGIVNSKTYKTDFTWKKRIWPIDTSRNGVWYDKRGIGHSMFDVRYVDGQYQLYQLQATKTFIDKCSACSNEIGIDTLNAWNLLKRKTISPIWGIDQSHIMLLMILGVVALVLGAGIMFMYGETQKLNAQIITLTKNNNPSGATITTNMILGEMLIVR